MSDVCTEIRKSINNLLEHPSFKNWLANEKPEEGDYILVNNSFVFRDVKTVKSEYHICLVVDGNGHIIPDPKIVTGIRLNVDLKRLSNRIKSPLKIIDISQAVSNELAKIGYIVFLLIGQIEDVALTETIGHSAFKSITWDPSASQSVLVSNASIIVKEVHDEESIWEALQKYFQSNNQNIPSGLREAMGIALTKLQDQATAEVEIPRFGTQPGKGITDTIVQVLKEQRVVYKTALEGYLHAKESNQLNEILRIAYNFACDATEYIRLIVSVSDIKPIVLWGTIAEHYALSEAFRNLQWMRSQSKPYLSDYERTIANARNSAFHNLFPFRKTLRVPLPEMALQGAELRIFSEYSRKKENQLTYQDKALVDVFMEFTRAREQRLSDRFWQQNLLVMDATIALFEKTCDFLRVLHAEMSTYSSKSE